jgi:allophanate hydrolase
MSDKLLSIATLSAAYKTGVATPISVIEQVLARVDAYDDPAVWIYRVPPETVRERARALEADPKAQLLPLYGIPFAVKDNIDVAGLPTTAGCPAFAYTPESSATVVDRLVAAGAILIGKTNLDQFATGLVGTRSPHGAPRSVFNKAYISGGSSSGSAVAVAAGLVAFALGTDTAGSGRVPAAFNNLVGLKPSKGLISTNGVVPACRSLDCVSIFAEDVAGALAVLDVAVGFDAADPYSREESQVALPPLEKLRVGILNPADQEFFGDSEAARLYHESIDRLVALGTEPVPFDFAPFRAVAALLYEGPWVAERLAGIQPFFAVRADEMDPAVRRIIGGAEGRTAVEAFQAEYRLRALAREAAACWSGFDVMLLPTTPTIYTVDEIAADPIGNNSRLGLYTNFVNLLDYAAIAIPAGFRGNGLPAGVTLIGPAFCDHDLAARAARLLDPCIEIAVAGAHLSGLPLNHELTSLGGRLVRTARTAAHYRLMALAGTNPPKPGLVSTPGFSGPGIEVEIWSLAPEQFGRFVEGVPAPMGIGKVMLADGRVVPGFMCEAFALEDSKDITQFGGWRAYLAQLLGLKQRI